ncbi:MAG: cytochrome c oxidase subunit II [Chloroflexi bacterium]|nr:cytochrome c oxidase subunit II [Chloroflexota bacterium]MDE2651296.1 cytochrome c oxidase subunit II [Chloroflexota bacterium]
MNDNRNRSPSISPGAVVVAAIFLLVSVIGINWFTSFVPVVLPPQASAESKSVDDLFYVLVIIGGIVFFLIQGMLLISVIFFRAKSGDQSDGPTYHGNPLLEIVWTIIPAGVVVFLAVLSFNVWMQNTEPKATVNMIDGNEIKINVSGARYAWTHTYQTGRLDDNGEQIVINSGDKLHTYIGQNIELELRTQDVIHSYWVPAMRVKQDLLPGNPATGGRPTELRFTPVRVEDETYPAAYPIVCAELCGDGHGRMTGEVIVYADESHFLEQFYEPAIYAILNPPADPVLRGEILIQEYICNSCHTLDSLEWSSRTGPSLNGIAERAGERVPGQSAEEYLVQSIWNSQAFTVPGYTEQMAAFGPDQTDANAMNAEQLYAITAYLCTQGEQTDCDTENQTTAIPAAIKTSFGLDVDITFGQSAGEAGTTETADEG